MILLHRRVFPRFLSVILALLLSGISPLLAASNALEGIVSPASLPSLVNVRATPQAADHAAQFASVGANGTYRFSDLPEGTYILEVLDLSGEALPAVSGVAPLALVPEAGVVIADLRIVTSGPQEDEGEGDEEDDDDDPAGAPGGGGGAPWGAWLAAGLLVGLVAAATLSGGSGDEACIPTASPVNPCP